MEHARTVTPPPRFSRSLRVTIAPSRRAVEIACRPATPAPSTSARSFDFPPTKTPRPWFGPVDAVYVSDRVAKKFAWVSAPPGGILPPDQGFETNPKPDYTTGGPGTFTCLA